MGTCSAVAADGALCNAMSGPICLFPAACQNNACTIGDPSACK